LKANHYGGQPANYWFWRTHAQQEIDYVEEQGGVLSVWENSPTFGLLALLI
jgi:hypothetical protein